MELTPLLDGLAAPQINVTNKNNTLVLGDLMNGAQIRRDAKDAYSGWLSAHPWDLFLTMTDPGLSHPEAMGKRTRHFMNMVNTHLYGNNWKRRTDGIEWVTGLETQKRGSWHSHSVIRLPHNDINDRSQFSIIDWKQKAEELGGWAKLERPRQSSDIVEYVCKYVCKEGELDWSQGFNPDLPKGYSHTLHGANNVT